jgi:xylulokinase
MRVKEYLVGLDIGSTNIKCAIYDTEGHAVTVAVHPTSGAYLNMPGLPGRFFEPETLWKLALTVGVKAFSALDGPYVLKGIAVASVGCDCIFLDRQDRPVLIFPGLKPVQKAFEYWQDWLGAKAHFEETGYPLDAANTEFFIAACAAADKDSFARVSKLMSVADYISYRLTGVFVREYSTAASMGLTNVHTHMWRKDFLDESGLKESVLGTPVYGGKYIGGIGDAAAVALHIPKGTPVYTGGHDYLCSALACGADSGSMLDVSGTVEVVSLFTDTPMTHLYDKSSRFIIDHSVVPGGYSFMTEAVGMGCVEWFRKKVMMPKGLDTNTFYSINRGNRRNRLLFLPSVAERMIAENNRDIKEAFLFSEEKTDAAEMLYAIFEGLSFQCRYMAEKLQKACPGNTRFIQAGGGASRKEWTQLRADILGLPVFVPAIAESTAMGAALLAGVGSGVYASYAEAAAVAASLGGYTSEPDQNNVRMYKEIYETIYLPAAEAFSQSDAGGIYDGGKD